VVPTKKNNCSAIAFSLKTFFSQMLGHLVRWFSKKNPAKAGFFFVELGGIEPPSGDAKAGAFYRFRVRLFSEVGRLSPGQRYLLFGL